jgi:hypothetical protein
MSVAYLIAMFAVVPSDDPVDKLSLSRLSQEIGALQTLYDLSVTLEQLKALRKLGEETAAKPAGRPEEQASKEVRKVMTELRAALIDAKNHERIEELTQELEKRIQGEEPKFDDDYEVTDGAVEKTPEALRLLTPAQVAAFVGYYADAIVDPRELLRAALSNVRTMPADEWKEYRDGVAAETSSLLGGIDAEKVQQLSDEIVQWLIIVRSLSDKEFKDPLVEQEKKIDEIIGKVGPTDVLRHFMEQTIAELLSNPRLLAAIDARLK